MVWRLLFFLFTFLSTFSYPSVGISSSSNSNNLVLRTGYSKAPSDYSDGSADSFDNYNDLRSLFRNRDGIEENSRAAESENTKKSSYIELPVQSPVASIANNASPFIAISALWSGLPSVIRFGGWYLLMESSRFLSKRIRHMWDVNQSRRKRFSSSNNSPSPGLLDGEDYLSGLGSEVIPESESRTSSSEISTSGRNNVNAKGGKASSESTNSAISMEQLQAEQAELWNAISKLHGLQTESLSSQKTAESTAEQKWTAAVSDLEQMVASVQGLAARMEQRLADTAQQVESLTQDLDELHSEVFLFTYYKIHEFIVYVDRNLNEKSGIDRKRTSVSRLSNESVAEIAS